MNWDIYIDIKFQTINFVSPSTQQESDRSNRNMEDNGEQICGKQTFCRV